MPHCRATGAAWAFFLDAVNSSSSDRVSTADAMSNQPFPLQVCETLRMGDWIRLPAAIVKLEGVGADKYWKLVMNGSNRQQIRKLPETDTAVVERKRCV